LCYCKAKLNVPYHHGTPTIWRSQLHITALAQAVSTAILQTSLSKTKILRVEFSAVECLYTQTRVLHPCENRTPIESNPQIARMSDTCPTCGSAAPAGRPPFSAETWPQLCVDSATHTAARCRRQAGSTRSKSLQQACGGLRGEGSPERKPSLHYTRIQSTQGCRTILRRRRRSSPQLYVKRNGFEVLLTISGGATDSKSSHFILARQMS